MTGNGSPEPLEYDGIGRIGLRAEKRGLRYLPDKERERKVNGYQRQRGYEDSLYKDPGLTAKHTPSFKTISPE